VIVAFGSGAGVGMSHSMFRRGAPEQADTTTRYSTNLSCQIVKAQQRAQFEKDFYENYPRKESVRQRGSQPMLEDKRTPQDEISALKSSAQKGDAAAQTWLGWKSSNGQGVPQNWEEALNWHSKAAEQGGATAQNNLGAMCQNLP